jgi:hypothetical protein
MFETPRFLASMDSYMSQNSREHVKSIFVASNILLEEKTFHNCYI